MSSSLQTERISQKEMLQISQEIGGNGQRLAARLERLTTWQQILQEPTSVDKVVSLLFEWDKGGGEHDDLVQLLKELQLAEKLVFFVQYSIQCINNYISLSRISKLNHYSYCILKHLGWHCRDSFNGKGHSDKLS